MTDGAGTARRPATSAMPTLDGVRHRFVDLPGLRMHVAEAGTGEPVLLLHGFPQHWWEWRDVIIRLADHYHVICPDLRGAGWTDAPPGGYSRDVLFADVVALLDELDLDRIHLVGHDWGALIGVHLCLRQRDRVEDYLCLSVPPPFSRFDPRLLMGMWRLWFDLVLPVPLLGPRLLSVGKQRLPRHLLHSHAARGRDAWLDRDVELYVAQFRDPARARAASALYRNFVMPEAVRIFTGAYRDARLTTPTRLLIGAEDSIVGPAFLHGYEDHVDDLTVEFVDGAAHFIVDERPDIVAERALELMAR